MKKLILFIALALSLSACSIFQLIDRQSDPIIEMQTTRQVTGEMVDFINQCPVDGICAYIVETESGEEVTVIWAEGMSPICQNDPFEGGDTDIQVGDSIDSLGRVIDADTTSACGDPSYYIRKTG